METSATTDLLHDLEDEITFLPAPKGMRLVNFIIDMIVVSIINSVIGGMIQMMIFAAYISDINTTSDFDLIYPIGLTISIWAIQVGLFLSYYVIFEKMMNGRTVGKLVSGTMTVRKDGGPLTWKNVILRSVCRLIPLEFIFAIFMEPLHDSFTGTVVVKKTL